MKWGYVYLILLMGFSIYGQYRWFSTTEESVAGHLALGYAIAILYAAILLVASFQVYLFTLRARQSWIRVPIEKIGLLYMHLVWRHKFDVMVIFQDFVGTSILAVLTFLWIWKSRAIGVDLVHGAAVATGHEFSERLLPGKDLEQKQFNIALAIIFSVVFPMVFWDAELLFG